MSEMAEKIQTLWPELILTATAFTVMILGLSPRDAVRRAAYPLSMLSLAAAAAVGAASSNLGVDVSPLAQFVKVSTALVGMVLLLLFADVPDTAGSEAPRQRDGWLDLSNTFGGEMYGFFLLSLVGLMLCASAENLIWLFLALELTSLPTYVMVAISRRDIRAPEAAVKYFFLGAMSAAIFLYGFALLYGATGSTELSVIREVLAEQVAQNDQISGLALAGLILTCVGLAFKVAAFPMHGYVADVYQGADSAVSAFLAYVPKTAGFIALALILATVGWPLDPSSSIFDNGDLLFKVLWFMAVITMYLGNTLALVQWNVKRVLAYSSIAHSGYILAAIIAGQGSLAGPAGGGVSAAMFYLVAYGLMNGGAFAVLALLRRHGEEVETFEDLRGLARRQPLLAAAMAVCVLSLLGLPPLVGFWGKAYLMGSVLSAGYTFLAIHLAINSAIGAYYYLKIVGACYLFEADREPEVADLPTRRLGVAAAAVGVVLLSIFAGSLMEQSEQATDDLGKKSIPTVESNPATTSSRADLK
jgi:NADH-quinone oxidoreductase subunit N